MKRVGNLMDRITSLDNICLAYCKARRGKQFNKEVVDFSQNVMENLLSLQKCLIEGKPDVGHYSFFTIYDPKEREICAAAFRERVMQHAIMNVCHSYFDRTLIADTYATRRGKGTYAALDKAKYAMAHYKYCSKLDVRKYYDSINHEVLKNKLERIFKDKALLNLFNDIVDSYSVSEGVGLPIGNLTSQYFANLYLSELDHICKERLKVPVYVRYMDDILIFSDSRQHLRETILFMNEFAEEKLFLQFKPPVNRRTEQGVVFLGYKVMPHCVFLSGRSKRRFRKKMKIYNELLASGKWSQEEFARHAMPLIAFTQHAASKKLRMKLIG